MHSSPSGPASTSAWPGARGGSGPAADATSEPETLAGGVRLCDWVRSHESDLCTHMKVWTSTGFETFHHKKRTQLTGQNVELFSNYATKNTHL